MGWCGPRTVLRTYSPTDAALVWEAIDESRAELLQWAPDIGRRQSVGQVQAGLAGLCQSRAAGTLFVCGIWDRRDGGFLGEVGLHDIDWTGRTSSVGYWLRRRARRQGLMAEALGVLQRHAVHDLGLRRFEAHIAYDNRPSRHVVERYGYLLTGHRRADPQWDGATRLMLIYTSPSGRLQEE